MGERAQSNLIGTVLLIGLISVAFSTTLATVVPQEAERAERDHREEILTDMTQYRNSILNTFNGQNRRTVSIGMGVEYPALVDRFANPTPSEVIRYEELGTARVDTAGGEITGERGTIVYDPNYQYVSDSDILIEGSVVERNDVSQTDQQLIRGSQINLVSFSGDFNLGSGNPITFDVIPSETTTTTTQVNQIEIPSQLSADEWRELLEDQMGSDGYVESVSKSGDTVTIDLDDSEEYQVRTGTVGLDSTPDGGARNEDDDDTEEDESNENSNPINPYEVSGMTLDRSSFGSQDVVLTFSNEDDTTEITQIQANFYQSVGGGGDNNGEGNEEDNNGGGGSPGSFDVVNEDGNTLATDVAFGEDAVELDSPLSVSGSTEVTLQFDSNVNQNQDFFMITITTSDGSRAQYLVG